MPEEVLFEFERQMAVEDIGSYLRTVAEKLEQGETLTLERGDESIDVTPPSRPTFEVKVEREWSGSDPERSGEIGLEFELEWDENSEDGGEFSIS